MRIRWRNFELPMRVVCDKPKLTSSYGMFFAEPFERGFGHTIGNSLRRVLLSAIEGSAVTSVKIKGVQHEFTTLPGIYEDVTDIILNIKKLLVSVHVERPVKLSLRSNTKGPITAAQIQTDGQVEIVNPTLNIATLVENVEFDLEMEARRGRGYVTADENLKEPQEVGVIPIDSFFSPVRRVRYRTENTRVGKMTNYDRLIMEIWTNGTIAPEMVIVEASKILRKHLNPFIQYFEIGEELKNIPIEAESSVEEDPNDQETRKKLDQPMENLQLSVRATNCLNGEGIKTIRDLVMRSENDLLQVRNLGKTSLHEIKEKLKEFNLSLGMQFEEAKTEESLS